LNTSVEQDKQSDWLAFPLECRAHHPWRPGTVTISWEPCGCPPAQAARGGHLKVACGEPGCTEVWWRPRHRLLDMPKILGHHRPGYR
jgi:hypothetical protein